MAPPNPHNAMSAGTPHIMCSYLDDDYLYGLNLHMDGDATVVRWRRSTGAVVATSPLLSTVASNRLSLPLKVTDGSDSHYTLSLLVDDQDHIHVMGNHHDEGAAEVNMRYVQCTSGAGIATSGNWIAGDTTAWRDHDSATTDEGTYTYHVFERMPNGTSLAFMSQSRTGSNSKGRRWLGFKRTAGTWTGIVGASSYSSKTGYFAVSDSGDGYLGTPPYANRVYITGTHIEAADYPHPGRLHVGLIWRTNDEFLSSQQAPCYIYSDDLTTWYRADGSVQPMPIRWGAGGGTNDNRTDGNGTAIINGAPNPCETQWGLDVDATTGYPCQVIQNSTDLSWHLFAWNGSTWTDTTVTGLFAEPRPLTVPGLGTYYRHVNTNRSAFRHRSSTSGQICLGGPIRTAGVEPAFDWCPVLLREEGKVYSLIGVGDTPYVWSFGADGARRRPA